MNRPTVTNDVVSDQNCAPAPQFPASLARDLPIINRKGLHARATAKLVHCIEQFDADVKVTRCGETVGGTSIMAILTLGAGMGTTITVSAAGPQAHAALEAITALIAARFGEDE
jgi:phosphocarrier protein HPr